LLSSHRWRSTRASHAARRFCRTDLDEAERYKGLLEKVAAKLDARTSPFCPSGHLDDHGAIPAGELSQLCHERACAICKKSVGCRILNERGHPPLDRYRAASEDLAFSGSSIRCSTVDVLLCPQRAGGAEGAGFTAIRASTRLTLAARPA